MTNEEKERDALKAEMAEYRRRYGCLSCGEDHPRNVMCPPHEMRTTGQQRTLDRLKAANIALTSAQDCARRLRAALDKAEEALKPIGNCVYNDNGDMIVDTRSITYDDLIACYSALTAIRTAKEGGG